MEARVLSVGLLAAALCAAAGAGQGPASGTGGGGARTRLPGTLPGGPPVLHVPGDAASVQEAIDMAPDGCRIVVHGGEHPPITIDRPLVLVGEDGPSIGGDAVGTGVAPAPVRLAGPGAGRVVLCDLSVGAAVNGFTFAASEAGIAGGGFDELRLYGCTVDGPAWYLLTGVALGRPGVEVDVPSVLLAGSVVRGSDSVTDDCAGSGPGGPAGLVALEALVVALDSTVIGGGAAPICGTGSCPVGGAGGPGVVAGHLMTAGSSVVGGAGAIHVLQPGWQVCGQAPDGPPALVARWSALGEGLTADGPPRVGGAWTLRWSEPGPAVLLVAPERTLVPLRLAFLGWSFLDPGPAGPWRLLVSPGGEQTLVLPPVAGLAGYELSAQLLRLAGGLSRPVIDLVRP